MRTSYFFLGLVVNPEAEDLSVARRAKIRPGVFAAVSPPNFFCWFDSPWELFNPML